MTCDSALLPPYVCLVRENSGVRLAINNEYETHKQTLVGYSKTTMLKSYTGWRHILYVQPKGGH